MGAHHDGAGWRQSLRRELTWLTVLKIAALALLWWLFFSPASAPPDRSLSAAPAPAPAPVAARSDAEGRARD